MAWERGYSTMLACTVHMYMRAKKKKKRKPCGSEWSTRLTMSRESASPVPLPMLPPDFGSPGTERCHTSEPEEASCGSSALSTPFSQDLTKKPKRQHKALIFNFYGDIVVDDSGMKGKCNKCGRQIQGKYGVTSNFVTHLKVCDCFMMPCVFINMYV